MVNKKEEKLQEKVAIVEDSVEDVISPTEKIEEVENLDIEPEKLSLQIERTKEELAVISEVREELVKLYADYKEVEQLEKASTSENAQLKTDIALVVEQLNTYKIAEEKLVAEKYTQRLEQLSAKFRALGQEKSVEYLNSKDVTTITEFESIVSAALAKVGETTEMPSLTSSTQAESLSDNPEPSNEIKKEEPKVEKTEQLSNKDFFANICNNLTNEQVGVGKKSKFM